MRRFALIVLALALLGVACGGDEEPALQGTAPPAETEAATEAPATSVAGVDGTVNNHGEETFTTEEFDLEMELDDFYFEPTFVKAPGGATATIELHNEGDVTHNFTVEGTDVDEDVEAGETKTVTVELGTETLQPFFCEYHRGAGMQGGFRPH